MINVNKMKWKQINKKKVIINKQINESFYGKKIRKNRWKYMIDF